MIFHEKLRDFHEVIFSGLFFRRDIFSRVIFSGLFLRWVIFSGLFFRCYFCACYFWTHPKIVSISIKKTFEKYSVSTQIRTHTCVFSEGVGRPIPSDAAAAFVTPCAIAILVGIIVTLVLYVLNKRFNWCRCKFMEKKGRSKKSLKI